MAGISRTMLKLASMTLDGSKLTCMIEMRANTESARIIPLLHTNRKMPACNW